MKKKLGVLGFVFFVSDVITKVGFWPFWLLVPDLGPTADQLCPTRGPSAVCDPVEVFAVV